MANIYVRSTDGNDSDNGTTWALAKATLAGASAIAAAGDTVYVSQAHAETTAGALFLTWPGTTASPVRIICANDGAAPPTAVATTGVVNSTGDSSLIDNAGAVFLYYGLKFVVGAGSSSPVPYFTLHGSTPGRATYDACSFQFASIATNQFQFNNGGAKAILKDCTFKFADATQGVVFSVSGATLTVSGGSILSGGTSPTNFIIGNANAGRFDFDGFDFSNASAGMNLVSSTKSNVAIFRNCKMPASWSGALITGTIATGARYELYNSDGTTTNYRLWVEDALGSIKHETTLIRGLGANDGTNGISWKFVTSADAKFYTPLVSPEIVIWNEVVGSSITVTQEILRDSATNLKNDEVWLEVMYLSATGTPIGTFVSNAKADLLATAADQTTSTAAWTTTGMSNPNTQKLAVSFTPQMKGFIHARMKVGKASATVYGDPKLTVS